MAKIIKLTEGDLSRIVKRVIREDEEKSMVANKVEQIVDLPKVEMRIEDIYSNLSDVQKEKLKGVLDRLNIDEFSSAKEVHNKVENVVADKIGGEMGEGDENMEPKQKIARILHSIGAGNISAWGGVPAAILIGGAIGSVATGFALSWGVTGLLMGLAKLIAKDDTNVETNESYNRRNRKR
jgi:hypothetical protein